MCARSAHILARVKVGTGHPAVLRVVARRSSRGRGALAVAHDIRMISIAEAVDSTLPELGLGGAGWPPFGTVLVHGSEWLNGHGVNVYSNGLWGCYAGCSYGDGYGSYKYQCVDLVERLVNEEGWYKAILYGNGDETYGRAPASAFEKHPPGDGYQPVPGDIVSFANGDPWGHVAVVEWDHGGQIGLVEQNASTSGTRTVPFVGGVLDYPGFSEVGVLHAKLNTETNGGPASNGTGPAPKGPPGTDGYQLAFQANTNELIAYGPDSTSNTSQGMMSGTSPSITALPGGGYEMAFQANTGNLIVFGTAGDVNTQQGMKAGTSPSIAASPNGGFEVAFQANIGNLYTYNSASGPANLQQGMDNNTSPSIAALPGGGYEAAFQANTTNLIVVGAGGNVNTQQGMKAGTSPSIAASPNGGFEVAFQANIGNLYTYNSASGPANLQQGMDNNTSPSIAALPGGGYEAAFQANTTNLIVVGAGGNVNTQQGMKAGTSPSIAASPNGGFEVAFQANIGNLYTYNSASGPANLQQGMDNETSPTITP